MKNIIPKIEAKKGITIKPTIPLFMIGKKGTSITKPAPDDTTFTFTFGENIGDKDRKIAILIYELFIDVRGFDENIAVRNGDDDLEFYTDGTKKEAEYENQVILIDDIYMPNYTRGYKEKSLEKTLCALSNIEISISGLMDNMKLIKNPTFQDGFLSFEIPNILIVYMITYTSLYKKNNTLQFKGFDYRVAYYLETNQYKAVKHFYSKTKIPIYKIVDGLMISKEDFKRDPKSIIRKIVDSLLRIHIENKEIPLYLYNEEKRQFENRYYKYSTFDWKDAYKQVAAMKKNTINNSSKK